MQTQFTFLFLSFQPEGTTLILSPARQWGDTVNGERYVLYTTLRDQVSHTVKVENQISPGIVVCRFLRPVVRIWGTSRPPRTLTLLVLFSQNVELEY